MYRRYVDAANRAKGWKVAQVWVGFAADDHGGGVAYARLAQTGDALIRVPFRVRRFPALLEREVGYAAIMAMATLLRERGMERLRVAVDDSRLVNDVRERREIPAPLTLAYVRLRCALNQLRAFEIVDAAGRSADLTARARAEVAMHVAA